MADHTLRMPFGIAPGRDLKDLDEPLELAVESRVYRLSRDGDRMVVRVSGLSSAAEAKAHVDAVWRGLVWCLLERGIGFDADLTHRDVAIRDEPFPGPFGLEGKFDGIADGDGPCVFPSDKRVAFVRGGQVTATVSGPAETFLSTLIEGIQRTSGNGDAPERMRTALDLFAAHYYEKTPRAQLLTLATAIEVLAEPKEKSSEAQDLLDQWQAELESRMESLPEDGPEYLSLQSLGRELVFRREASIRSRVRGLPTDILGTEHENAASLGRKAVETYDARSTLVHTGSIESERLGRALEDGREVLKELLRAMLTG